MKKMKIAKEILRLFMKPRRALQKSDVAFTGKVSAAILFIVIYSFSYNDATFLY
jgi:hypothetical protein